MATLNKIQELGAFAYSSEKEGQFELTKSMISGVEKTLGILPEKEVLDFVSQYGFGYFSGEVGIIPIELPPVVTKEDPVCPVGRFFGFGDGKNSINNIIKTYSIPEQISIRCFPLCYGVSGDIFLYSLEEKSFGKIYYWYHEGDIGNDLFLVAEKFTAFIDGLQQIISKPAENYFKLSYWMLSRSMGISCLVVLLYIKINLEVDVAHIIVSSSFFKISCPFFSLKEI